MMKSEFEALTGIYVTNEHYKAIEAVYMTDTTYTDKRAFCKAYKANKDGMAERIAQSVSAMEFKAKEDADHKISEMEATIKKLQNRIDRLECWRPYEDKNNVSQSKYDDLRSQTDTKLLTDEEAIEMITNEFGFAPNRIKIIREVNTYEISREGRLRKTGTTERLPMYNATDWNYIRFNVCSRAYEMYGYELQLFSC